MSGRGCAGKREDGHPCGAPAMHGYDFCIFHSPDHKEEADEARRLGGKRRRRERVVSGAFDFEGLDSIQNVRRLVQVAALDTLGLENSVARNRTLAYLAQTATKLLEAGEFEERLQALEAALSTRGKR